MSVGAPAAPPPPPAVLPGYGRCAEDTAALLRARIASESAEQRRLLAELERLRCEAGGAADAGVPVAALPAGCSDPILADGQAEPERFVLLAAFHHCAPVAGVAVNAQDAVATAAWDGHASLFDLPLWRDLGHVSAVMESGAAPGSRSGGVGFADTALSAVAFMPGAPEMLGLAAAAGVQLLQVADGKPTWRACLRHAAPVSSIDFHSVQDLLGSAGDDGQTLLWDVMEQRVLRALPSGGAELTGCRFLGGGELCQFLVATSGLDGGIHVWDIRRPARVRSLEGPDAATCLDCHERSHVLATGRSDGSVGTMDLRTWQELHSLDVRAHTGPDAYARSLAVSPCGTFLAVGCMDGELLVCDVGRDSRTFKIPHHRDCVSALAWGGRTGWAAAPQFLACASLDGSWSCWGHAPGQ
mmetsp:Transcript_37168/g.104874  ORF Transcript_37168/g.104874 Transcript_37168/m.104874 type:complete len:413 (+) Transcript_37168:144-1382(+)